MAVLVVAPVLVLPKLFGASEEERGREPGIVLRQPERPTGLAVGGRPLFPLAAGSLARHAGQRVEGETAVLALVSPSGFWVGTEDDGQRVLVRQPREPVVVTEGAPVVLVGRIQALPADFAARFGISGGDADLVRRQGHYIEASRVRLV